jgi:hypothetical protein
MSSWSPIISHLSVARRSKISSSNHSIWWNNDGIMQNEWKVPGFFVDVSTHALYGLTSSADGVEHVFLAVTLHQKFINFWLHGIHRFKISPIQLGGPNNTGISDTGCHLCQYPFKTSEPSQIIYLLHYQTKPIPPMNNARRGETN